MKISNLLLKNNNKFEEKVLGDILQILHEIASPMASLKLGIDGLTDSITACDDIRSDLEDKLESILLNLSNDVCFIRNFFSKFEECVKHVHASYLTCLDHTIFVSGSVLDCFKQAKQEYLCRTRLENDIIQSCNWEGDDIKFIGDISAMKQVFYHLFKNAFNNIKQLGCGSIIVRSGTNSKNGELHFFDTTEGLKNDFLKFEDLSKLIGLFRSDLALGIHFCYQFMLSINGRIEYSSLHKQRNEFILFF